MTAEETPQAEPGKSRDAAVGIAQELQLSSHEESLRMVPVIVTDKVRKVKEKPKEAPPISLE